MELSLNDELKGFVRQRVQSGEFPSEEAVIEAALRQLRDREASSLERLVDQAFVEFCDRDGNDDVSLDEVLRATSTIPGSMGQAIIEEEREDRI